MVEHALTTIDNPYNPFDNYSAWYAYDYRMGHHTPAFLARVAVVSDELSDEDQRVAIEQAIDEILKENVSGIYKKVSRETKEQDA